MRSNYRSTSICNAHRIRRVCIGVRVLHRCQAVTIQHAINYHLISKCGRQRQHSTVILFGSTDRCNGQFLLIKQRELKTILGNCLCNLVVIPCFRSAVFGSLNGFVQFPTGNRRTTERERLAHFQFLNIGRHTRDRISGHVNKMHRHRCMLITGIIEVENVCFFTCSQNKCLFNSIREEVYAVQFRMCSIKSIIVNCFCQLNYGSGISRNVLYCLQYSDLNVVRILIRVKDVLDCILCCCRLSAVDESDLVILSF